MRLIVALSLLLWAGPVSAQTHPCDAAPATVTVTGREQLYVLFCVRPADNVVRVDLSVDGQIPDPLNEGDADAVSEPNVDGFVQFRAPLEGLAAGTHTVTVTAINLNEDGVEQASEPSEPYTFTVRAPVAKPSKPRVTGVTR